VTDLFPRLRRVLRNDLDQRQRAALASWVAFTSTFAGVRGITYSIRAGKGPFHNVSAGGEHLHHYIWGIGMLAGVGAVAVHGEQSWRSHPAVAMTYGSGLALIVDEFALLLDLKDVYWAKQGRVSVDIAVGGIAIAGSYFAALPALRALQRETDRDAAGRRADSGHVAPAHPAASGGLLANLAARQLGHDVELAEMPGILLK
jgi:hypothetical protein